MAIVIAHAKVIPGFSNWPNPVPGLHKRPSWLSHIQNPHVRRRYVICSTGENFFQLQKNLDALQVWESSWKMEFNPLKCEHVKFTQKRTKGANNNHIHNETDIPKTKGVKYLGLRLESSLRWNENFNYITNKAASIRWGFIRRAHNTILSKTSQSKSLPHTIHDKLAGLYIWWCINLKAGLVWGP